MVFRVRQLHWIFIIAAVAWSAIVLAAESSLPVDFVGTEFGNTVKVTQITPTEGFLVLAGEIFICPEVEYTFTLETVPVGNWQAPFVKKDVKKTFTKDQAGVPGGVGHLRSS